jgi:proteasome assembly chaperone (PAC2) family protein
MRGRRHLVIELEDVPELNNPVVIAAFEGWNDAGEAATAAVDHLVDVWDADAIAALDPEDYYDFQVNRPRVVLDEGRRRIHWRTTRILVASSAGLDRDVILVQGIEPSFRWRAFTIELMEFAQEVGATTVFTLGALMADVAHTRPIPVTATSDDDDVIHRFDLEPSRYEGPTGIVGVLADAASQSGLQSISCWAAVPHYAGHSPSPKATLALISRLATSPTAPRRGSAGSTSWPTPTTRWRSTSSPWRRPRTPQTCPKPAGTRSPASSSGTCAGADRKGLPEPCLSPSRALPSPS